MLEESISCEDGLSLNCLQSDLTFLQIMSRNANRFLIKELADLTGFHRNTTKKALIRLEENNQIQSMGSGNYTSYYAQSTMDHYRQIAHSLILIFNVEGRVDETVKEKLRSFGYALVRTNLENIVNDTYVRNYNHQTLKEGLNHLKMSYPFTEIVQERATGNIISLVSLDVEEKKDQILVHIKPCLCDGEEKNTALCEMVAGALQAGIHIACQQLSSKIMHQICSENKTCTYSIVNSPNTEEESTAFDELM